MTLDDEEVQLNVKVTDFTVQYILKDIKYDMPQPQPLRHYSAKLSILVPKAIMPYIPTYTRNRYLSEETDGEMAKDTCPFPYIIPKETVSKWKKWLKAEYPDYMPEAPVEYDEKGNPKKKRSKTDSDEIACAVISCTLEDTLNDALEECWDEVLGPKFKGAIPVAPEGYYVAGRYIHLLKWTPIIDEKETPANA